MCRQIVAQVHLLCKMASLPVVSTDTRGWRGSRLPSNLQYKKKMTRNIIIKFRVNENERDSIATQALEVGMTVSDFIRLRTLNSRLRKSSAHRDKIRELARIGANINQIARWVNVNKKHAEVLEVILCLVELTAQMQKLAEDDPCT